MSETITLYVPPDPPRTVRQCLGQQRSLAVVAAWDEHPLFHADQRAHLLESLTWPVHDGCGQAMAECAAARTVYTARALARDLAICVLG